MEIGVTTAPVGYLGERMVGQYFLQLNYMNILYLGEEIRTADKYYMELNYMEHFDPSWWTDWIIGQYNLE